MLRKLFLVFSLLVLVTLPVFAAAEIITGEQIKNGTFDTDYKPWEFVSEFGGNATVGVENGEFKVSLKTIGTEYWSVRLTQEKIQLVKGSIYVLKFDARSTIPRDICVMCEFSGDPYTKYFGIQNVAITDKMATYTFEFPMKFQRDNMARVVFGFGKVTDEITKAHDVFIDNVSFMVKK